MAERRDSSESFASLFEQSAGAKQAKPRRFEIGERLDVSVVAVTQQAVFADLGRKQEGIFERNELSDDEGKLLVEVGSRVTAVVQSIDGQTGQVRLSPVFVRTKQDAQAQDGALGTLGAAVLEASAAGKAASVLVEGAKVKGAVTGIERFGVFVQIAGTQGRSGRGLVPASETATPRGADLKKHFTVGQELEAKILNIDESGKIRLSIAALKTDEERGEFEAFAKAERERTDKGQKSDKPAPVKGFGTLGDLFTKKAKR